MDNLWEDILIINNYSIFRGINIIMKGLILYTVVNWSVGIIKTFRTIVETEIKIKFFLTISRMFVKLSNQIQ